MNAFKHVAVAVLAAGVTTAITGGLVLRATAAPGDSDSTFVPIAPCRLIDTRPAPVRVGPHGTFGADQTSKIRAHGSNGNCTIPADAIGLSLNVTAVNATAPTHVRIWGSGDKPLAASLNPAPTVPVAFNAVNTPLAGDGSFQIFNKQGSVDLIVDVNGYSTRSSLQDLHARLTALEALTASMSIEVVNGVETVRFYGVNVQVVSDAWETPTNGTGNLIIGTGSTGCRTDQSGSENLVVGGCNSFSGYGGIVAGSNNRITGVNASVTGGTGNTASGNASSVSGGSANTASGYASSVSGGRYGTASGQWSSVSGGISIRATGTSSSVSGGHNNTAGGDYSSVSGGFDRDVFGEDDWAAGSLFEDK